MQNQTYHARDAFSDAAKIRLKCSLTLEQRHRCWGRGSSMPFMHIINDSATHIPSSRIIRPMSTFFAKSDGKTVRSVFDPAEDGELVPRVKSLRTNWRSIFVPRRYRSSNKTTPREYISSFSSTVLNAWSLANSSGCSESLISLLLIGGR